MKSKREIARFSCLILMIHTLGCNASHALPSEPEMTNTSLSVDC